jgi:signal transduction histidine kinase
VAGACCLAGWRRWPRLVAVVGPGLLLLAVILGASLPSAPTTVVVVLLGYAALVAARFDGRAAWVAAAAAAAYLLLVYRATGESSPGLAILTVPGYLAGTAVRLRRRTADALAERGCELERERELYAEVAVRNERASIARELHDIVGHALSVVVVQAAAGQRLVDGRPEDARASLRAVAASASEGRADLQRLLQLLGGEDVPGPDLALVDEVVATASRTGLPVTCRYEGDRDGIGATASHIAFRVVQESLTNALRHAPGAAVHVLLRREPGSRALLVRVDSDPCPGVPLPDLPGSGSGLAGLRDRVLSTGGSFAAGRGPDGGWHVEATIGTDGRMVAHPGR